MITRIRPGQLDEWLRRHAGEHPLVLDVREPAEVRVACVRAEGFELLHIPMNQVPARLDELQPGRPTACLCHHGMRSMQVALFLARNGFDEVSNIDGGIDAWTLERDPGLPRY